MLRLDDVHVHIHGDSPEILRLLSELLTGQAQILAQGASILMSNAELHAVLDELNTLTNTLAATQTAQNTTLTEVAADIDNLIASTTDPTVKARLEGHRDTLSAAASIASQTADVLTQVAAKHDAPVPPPPPPIEG